MDIQLEKKKGIQKKHLPYIGGGVVILLLLGWIIFGNHASTLKVDGKSLNSDRCYRTLFLEESSRR